MASTHEPPPRVRVVGAAVLRRDPASGVRRVLVARRLEPPRLAGLWEFPGGKIEAGETEQSALRRECREELALDVEPGTRLGETPIDDWGTLCVWSATVVGGEMRLADHSEVRWLAAGELDDVAWIPSNRPLLGVLRAALRE